MVNKKNIIIPLLILGLLPSLFISSGEVTTYKKSYYAVKDSSIVSTRELGLLASLVYEDVPNDKNYINNDKNYPTKKNQGCINEDGTLKPNCFFKEYKNYVKSSRNGNPKVYQYIEGMSEQKSKSPVSDATTSLHEDGEAYYYLDFASAKELEEAGWVIYDYKDQAVSGEMKKFLQENFKLTTEDFKAVFSAITFKKGNNYVIAYRGTDFPDLFEWLDNFAYALNGQHSEASLAYIYAQDVYRKIVESNPKAKIYVTGHSLGAYLAQIGGAAIVDQEAGIFYEDMAKDKIKTNNFTKLSDYTKHYAKKTSKLEQVAYFNGMGVGGLIGKDSALVDNVQDALVYLSTHTKNGKIANSGRMLNYSDKKGDSNGIQSSGRLVLYSMDQDPISYIGFHYGEIYKLEPAADAVTNHRGNHNMTLNGMHEFLNNLTTNLKEDSLSFFEKLFGSEEKETSVDYEFAGALNAAIDTNANFVEALDKSKADSDIMNASNNFPAIVSAEVKKVSNVDVGNVNLFSMIGNLLGGGLESIDNYGLMVSGSFPFGVIDFFNINHETDSFACVIDKGNGTINKVNLTVSTEDSSISCDKNGICYYNGLYSDNLFDKLASVKTNTSKFIDKKLSKNVVLKAEVSGACAKYYEWQYNDGGSWKTFATTTDNRAVVPSKLTSKAHNFRVLAAYGDNFQETKTHFEDNKLLIGQKNSRKKSYSANPTLSEGLTVSNNVSKKTTASNTLTLTIKKDTTKPTCTTSTPVPVALSCSWLKCSSKNVNAVVTCSDTESGVKSITVDKFELKQGGVVLLPIIEKAGNAIPSDNSVNFPIKVLRKPTFNTPYIKVKVTVTDHAGNSNTFSEDIKFKISKSK